MRASRMSTIPELWGPSVTKRRPSGLQSRAPPTPGTRELDQVGGDRPVQRLSASGSARAVAAERLWSTAARASRTLRSASMVRLALAAAASSRAVATWRSFGCALVACLVGGWLRSRRASRRRGGWRWRRAGRGGAGSGGRRGGRARRSPVSPRRPGRPSRARNCRSRSVRSARRLLPLQRRVEPGTAVELAVRAAERLPAVGGGGEVAEECVGRRRRRRATTAAGATPGPGPRGRARTSRSSDVTSRARTSRPTTRSRSGVAEQAALGYPAADRVAVERRRDQPQQDRAQRSLAARRAGCRRADPPSGRRRRGCRRWPGSPRR